jgi:hypothetical protein
MLAIPIKEKTTYFALIFIECSFFLSRNFHPSASEATVLRPTIGFADLTTRYVY